MKGQGAEVEEGAEAGGGARTDEAVDEGQEADSGRLTGQG